MSNILTRNILQDRIAALEEENARLNSENFNQSDLIERLENIIREQGAENRRLKSELGKRIRGGGWARLIGKLSSVTVRNRADFEYYYAGAEFLADFLDENFPR
jgi:hypothetical protein